MKSKTDNVEIDEKQSGQIEDIQSDLEEDSNVEGVGELLEPEDNVFSRRLPTLDIAKAGYYLTKPEDYLIKEENAESDDIFWFNVGVETAAGAALGVAAAQLYDPTGLYTQALSDPDPVNLAMAGTAGLVGNSIAGAAGGGLGAFTFNIFRTMGGAVLATSGATYSFMSNNVLRGLEQGEKYLRDNQNSEVVDTTLNVFDEITAEAEAFYDRLRGRDDREIYSPETLDDFQQRFSELEECGDIDEVKTSFQALTDKSEVPEIIDYIQNEETIEVRNEDIQIEERQEGRVAKYHGAVDFHHDIGGEPYRGADGTYAIEFEAIINQSDMNKIDL